MIRDYTESGQKKLAAFWIARRNHKYGDPAAKAEPVAEEPVKEVKKNGKKSKRRKSK
jgi:hypothetical protein|tara:strand:- start:1022 stop:1192 length:171 start_codon:yes stop_codon:yes gene_type:complete